jgi:hypothetical protein
LYQVRGRGAECRLLQMRRSQHDGHCFTGGLIVGLLATGIHSLPGIRVSFQSWVTSQMHCHRLRTEPNVCSDMSHPVMIIRLAGSQRCLPSIILLPQLQLSCKFPETSLWLPSCNGAPPSPNEHAHDGSPHSWSPSTPTSLRHSPTSSELSAGSSC